MVVMPTYVRGRRVGFAIASFWLSMTGVVQAQVPPSQPVAATLPSSDLPAYTAVSEDISEQRRAVYVRVERRVDESDLLAIAAQVEGKAKKPFARTYVNFILPGMPVNQAAWASVLFAPEPKLMVHGLSRSDEALFYAEHQADRRFLLGSWLTSPPAAPGRLTIYADHGKVFAEWRLRSGQKTVDELRDSTVKATRRFDVPGGGYYVLTRSGDLEIWEKTALIATAERIRVEQGSPLMPVASRPTPSRVASAQSAPSMSRLAGLAMPAERPMQMIASAPDLAQAPLPPVVVVIPPPRLKDGQIAGAQGAVMADPHDAKSKAKKTAKAKSRQKVASASRSRDLNTGETIAAKISGRL